MGKKDKRVHNKMKKQIAELLLMGQQPDGVDAALNESMSSTDGEGPSKRESDIGMKVSRKLAAARREKQPGPELYLTLFKLGGLRVSHQEIASLVHYSLIGPTVAKPKWCNIRPWKATSQTVVLRVNCHKRFIETEGETFPEVQAFFGNEWIRMDDQVSKREDFWRYLLNVPIDIQQQIRERVKKLEAEPRGNGALKVNMLMTYSEMADNGFPFPHDSSHILPTKDRYAPVTYTSPIFSLDCEMCITECGLSELTRISVIREDGSVLLDTLVKPDTKITDYLTTYSGITEELLRDVDVRLSDVQKALQCALPPDAIIVGHSLEFDMRALRMSHPYLLDIASLYNISGVRVRRNGLKVLTSVFLNTTIQDESGHCSVIDADVTLKLLQLKLKNGLIFGNCLFGWNYDEWIEEVQKKYDQNGSAETSDEPICKKSKEVPADYSAVKLCSCGTPLTVPCIVGNCQCKVSKPATECVRCLSKIQPSTEDLERATFDWKASIAPLENVTTRPLPFYLFDTHKTVLSAMHATQDFIPESRVFSRRDPSSYAAPSEYFTACSMDLLEHGLALMEYNHEMREGMEIQQEMNNMDAMIHQILRSSARFALVIVVFSSPETSICHVKVKR